jgi:hypothetical protein
MMNSHKLSFTQLFFAVEQINIGDAYQQMYTAVYPVGACQEIGSYPEEKNKLDKTEKQVYQWYVFEHIPGYKQKNNYVQRYQKKAAGIDKTTAGLDYMSNSVNQY